MVVRRVFGATHVRLDTLRRTQKSDADVLLHRGKSFQRASLAARKIDARITDQTAKNPNATALTKSYEGWVLMMHELWLSRLSIRGKCAQW